MKQPVLKNIDRQKAAAARNAAHRKKVIAALLLLVVMALLWVRIFSGKGKPAAVSAAVAVDSNQLSAQMAGQKIVYIELPYIPQRHNAIANDVFSAGNFKRFNRQNSYASNNERNNADQQFSSPAEAAAADMKLTAIVGGKKPQAFIENKLFEKGQSFKYMFHGQIYRFKILNILEDRVELDCNGIMITRKIPQPF